MVSIILVLVVFWQLSSKECFCLKHFDMKNNIQFHRHLLNRTNRIEIHAANSVLLFNETTLANFTFTVRNSSGNLNQNPSKNEEETQVDCFGLGSRVARILEKLLRSNPNGSDALDVQFFLTSREHPYPAQVVPGDQFGLEWTDFKIERRTVIIVHGFLSDGQETWISNLEKALLAWVNCRTLLNAILS
jgi:hypothetical protein